LAGNEPVGQTAPKPEREEPLPGQFVSDDLQSDTRRFLEQVKAVVRRRSEAGLERVRC
jgi:hypothetical protein